MLLNGANRPMLFDAHNHLQDAWLAPHRAHIFADLRPANVGRVVVNGTCQTDWADVSALAREHPVVLPSFGVHPWDAGNTTATWRDDLHRALEATPSAAIGEIGLDRWILDRARPDDPRLAGLRRASLAEQEDIFGWQLELAAQRNLPASVHCLDAWGELLRVVRQAARPAPGFLLHAYGGSAELAREFAALGAYFSFNTAFIDDRYAARRAVFATLPAENNYPALPVWQNRHVHVALLRSAAPLPPLPTELMNMLRRAPETLVLSPTARTRLR